MRYRIVDTDAVYMGSQIPESIESTEALFRQIFEEGIRAGQEHADEEDIWKQLISEL